jgi:hypothetical protein
VMRVTLAPGDVAYEFTDLTARIGSKA